MTSKKIFVDSSVLYSFIDRSDSNHSQAVKTLENLSLQGMTLYTSVQSIQEAYNAVERHMGKNLSFEFLQVMLESTIEIIYPQKIDLMSAFRIIKTNKNKQVSLREVLTAVLMQKKGIYQIFTFNYWQNLLGSTPYMLKI